jgi:hypothetical protein
MHFRLLLQIVHFLSAQLTIAVESQKRSLSQSHGKVKAIIYKLFGNLTNYCL